MLRRKHRNMGTGAGFPAGVAMGGVWAMGVMAAGLLCVGVANACEPIVPLSDGPDLRIEVEPDGRFKNAAVLDEIEDFGGLAVSDQNHGRVAQRLVLNRACDHAEMLLVSDCESLGVIRVNGVYDESDPRNLVGGYLSTRIDPLLYPSGPIRLSRMDVAEIAKVAEKNHYTYALDVVSKIKHMKKRNRYDPFFGCKIFYPESPGAKQKRL